MKKAIVSFLLTVSGLLIFNVATVGAQTGSLIDTTDNPDVVAGATGDATSFRILAKRIVDYFLTFLGFIAVIMIIYGGILYVTAAGEQEKIDTAKKILMYAAIGIIVILLSFAIVNTIIGAGTGTET